MLAEMSAGFARAASPDDEPGEARASGQPRLGDRGKHLASERSAADRNDLRLLDQRSDGLGRLLGSRPSGLTEQSLEMPDRIASDSGADLVAEHKLEAAKKTSGSTSRSSRYTSWLSRGRCRADCAKRSKIVLLGDKQCCGTGHFERVRPHVVSLVIAAMRISEWSTSAPSMPSTRRADILSCGGMCPAQPLPERPGQPRGAADRPGIQRG
ncbi:MAG: hypothetical protein QOF43_1658 [Gaiellaceae bacterium]|nr:hypothetical protein [Gaiellaceae bacterium]